MPLTVATATASFRSPELSEDRLAVHRVPGGVAVVVADGAGGMAGGGLAADLAIKFVEDALARPEFNPLAPGSWVDLLVEADRNIEAASRAGETTCVIIAITSDGRVVGTSCGDSGALVVAIDGTIDDLTAHQKRKLRLGSGRAVPVAFERPALNGTLVVASDGLLSYMRPDVVAEVVLGGGSDLDDVARQFVERVRLPSDGLMDDVVVAIVRMSST